MAYLTAHNRFGHGPISVLQRHYQLREQLPEPAKLLEVVMVITILITIISKFPFQPISIIDQIQVRFKIIYNCNTKSILSKVPIINSRKGSTSWPQSREVERLEIQLADQTQTNMDYVMKSNLKRSTSQIFSHPNKCRIKYMTAHKILLDKSV